MGTALAKKINTPSHFTYADYAEWPEYPRYELFNGEATEMSAPSIDHQEISMALSIELGTFLKGKKCKLLASPVDVRINYKTRDNTVLQPDLIIVCDESKIENRKCCLGAPDMAIEILSESTRHIDMLKKFNIYLEAGVREYWIVSPEDKIITVHVLENNNYVTRNYGEGDTIQVHVLDGCKISLADIFA